MGGYKKGIFYDDAPLVKMLSDFMDTTIVSAKYSSDDIRSMLQAMKNHVVNHRFFLVGLYVE